MSHGGGDADDGAGALLKITDLDVLYGRAWAVNGVGLELRRGEIRVILGANGAGKSTILKAVMGLVPARRGMIEYPEGREIRGQPPHRISRLGVAWVPEGRQIFPSLTVRENLRMGAWHVKDKAMVATRTEEVMELFPVLRTHSARLGGSLSGGEQQMLAIGRALMSGPTVLLLDEPSLGLAPMIVEQLFELVVAIRARGLAILMAEQNARAALAVADHAYLLEKGVMRGEGAAREMELREDVRAAYLGG